MFISQQPFRSRLLVLLLLSLAAGPLVAQPPKVRVDNNPIAANIEEGLKHVANQKWVDAIEQFQRVIDTSGDELVPLDAHQWLQARWIVHREIGKLPKEPRELYRKRVDAPAQKRLETAKKNRDFDLLRSILKDWFCSRPTEEAINTLGDEAFVAGDFDEAERYWRMLFLPASYPLEEAAFTLRFPDPQTDPAAIRARLILLQIFRGEIDAANQEMLAFRKSHLNSEGYFAGRKGKYIDILEEMLKSPPAFRVSRSLRGDTEWPTFGGNLARNGHSGGTLPYYFPDRPTWRVEIPQNVLPEGKKRRERDEFPVRSSDHPRGLVFHPVIWQDHVLINDASRILAFGLLDGKPANLFEIDRQLATEFDLKKSFKVPIYDATLPAHIDVRYTMTLASDLLFVRMGAQRFASSSAELREEEPRETDTFLVCLGPVKGSKKPLLSQRWVLQPKQDRPDAPLLLEGSPVVQGDRLFIGMWRIQGGEAISYVACFEGLDQAEPPQLIWQREIGKATFLSGEPRAKAELLSLKGNSLYFCSPSGTVISLDTVTGKPNWEFRYPKRDPDRPREAFYGRDLCPAVIDGGRVFAAPADAEKIFALDEFTGQLLWESRNLEAMHLLGVSKGKLIVTLDRPMRGICGLNVETGTERFPNGWLQHDGEGESTFGKGLLAEGVVFWPTKGGLHFLNAEDGSPLRQPVVPRDGNFAIEPMGNLLFGRDTMIVATPTELWGYVSEKKFVPVREKEAKEPPKNSPILREELRNQIRQASEKPSSSIRMSLFRTLLATAHQNSVMSVKTSDEIDSLIGLARGYEEGKEDQAALATWQRLIVDHGEKELPGTGKNKIRDWVRLQTKLPLDLQTPKVSRSLEILDLQTPLTPQTRDAAHEASGNDLPPLAIPFQGSTSLFEYANSRIECSSNQLFRQEGKNILWQLRPEDLFPPSMKSVRPLRSIGSIEDSPEFTGFHLVGDLLFTIFDGSRLLAIDVETGLIRWEQWAISERALWGPNKIVFQPHFYVDSTRLLVQLSHGRIRLLDSQSGKIVSEMPGSSLPWKQEPVRVSEGQVVLARDSEHLLRVDLQTGKIVWTYPLPRVGTLAGELPQIRSDGEHLLVGIQRSQGFDLDRLDPVLGTRIWGSPTLLPGEEIDLADVGIDEALFYVATENAVTAFTLQTGERVWRVPLDLTNGSHWQVKRLRDALLILPREARRAEFIASLGTELERTFSSGIKLHRWPEVLQKSYHAWKEGHASIYLLEPGKGNLLQRLELDFSLHREAKIRSWFHQKSLFLFVGESIFCLSGQ